VQPTTLSPSSIASMRWFTTATQFSSLYLSPPHPSHPLLIFAKSWSRCLESHLALPGPEVLPCPGPSAGRNITARWHRRRWELLGQWLAWLPGWLARNMAVGSQWSGL